MNIMTIDEVFKENLQINFNEIEDKRIILSSKPIRLNVVLTTMCNLSCLMCEVRKIPWRIPEKVIREIISLLPFLQEIVWQGGEVFLLDYFKELLREAGNYPNLTHEITTNGHLINEDWLELLNRINLNLNISIDGFNKAIYEYIRKGSRFEDIIKTLSLINETRDKRPDRSLTLVLIITVMRSNFRELERVIDFARQYNFDRVILQPVKGNYDNKENIFFYNEEKILQYISGVKKMIKDEAKGSGIKLVDLLPVPSYGLERERTLLHEKTPPKKCGETRMGKLLCRAPWQQMFIEWGGYVYPHCLCIQDGSNESKKIGSVLEESLTDIWNGKKMQLFRKKITDNTFQDICNPDCVSGLISADVRDVPPKL